MDDFYKQMSVVRQRWDEQADGEYIPRRAVLETIDKWHEDKADIEDLIIDITYMQGVAIPIDGEYILKETARRIIDSPRNKEQMLRMLNSIPSVSIPNKRPKTNEIIDASYGTPI